MSLRILALALAASVLVAGCTAPPAESPPTSDVSVDVADASGEPVVITLGVAANHTGFAVEYVDGTTEEFPDARGVVDLPDAVVPRIVSLRPTGDDVQTRTYRWDSGQSATAVFEDVPRNATVYYSVASPTGNEPMRTLGSLTCGPDAELLSVFLHVNADGSIASGNDCRVD